MPTEAHLWEALGTVSDPEYPLSIVDLGERRLLNTVLLDDPAAGAANPWGVAVTPGGGKLVVAHAGSHELSVIDLSGLLERLTTLAPEVAATVRDDLSFLGELRKRVSLPGRGPRGLAVAGDAVWVA